MFNSLYVDERSTEYHTHVQIVDPSVPRTAKHLDELQKEAEERVKSAILVNIEAFGLQLVDYRYAKSMADFKLRHYIAFKLNGQEVTLEVEEDEGWNLDKQGLIKRFADRISAELVERILRTENPFTSRTVK